MNSSRLIVILINTRIYMSACVLRVTIKRQNICCFSNKYSGRIGRSLSVSMYTCICLYAPDINSTMQCCISVGRSLFLSQFPSQSKIFVGVSKINLWPNWFYHMIFFSYTFLWHFCTYTLKLMLKSTHFACARWHSALFAAICDMKFR